VAALVA